MASVIACRTASASSGRKAAGLADAHAAEDQRTRGVEWMDVDA
jgi:hypothetical protein